jgi:hypothetical protein
VTDYVGKDAPAQGLTVARLRKATIDDTTQLLPELRQALAAAGDDNPDADPE